MERNALAEKMEIIGRVFEIDGMYDLLSKYEKGMNTVKFNAVTIQVSSLLLKSDRYISDKLVSLHTGKTDDEVQEMEDGAYANALKNAILADVMGFFVSSPPSAGKK